MSILTFPQESSIIWNTHLRNWLVDSEKKNIVALKAENMNTVFDFDSWYLSYHMKIVKEQNFDVIIIYSYGPTKHNNNNNNKEDERKEKWKSVKWNIAILYPMYKKRNPIITENNREISLLHTDYKVLITFI